MAIFIDVMGTERFHGRWTGSSDDTIDDIKSWSADCWSTYIEDGSGEYDPYWYAWTENDVAIPESALSSGDGATLGDRCLDAHIWLDDNWGLYDGSDAVHVVDYYGEGNGPIGTTNGLAGENIKTSAVDGRYGDGGDLTLPQAYQDVGLPAAGYHEITHMFSGDHQDATINWNWFSPDEVSVMYSPAGPAPGCHADSGTPEVVRQLHSSCTTNELRAWIDDNL